jgi:uncharacterized damage-inducible protein DinB
MQNELPNLAILLQRSFKKNAWHGPSVRESLENVTPELAQKRIPGTHSIIELVAHMTSWRMFVVKRLQGDADFKVSDEANFPAATDWVATLNALEESHTQLMEALKSFPEHKLHETVPNASAPYSFYILLHGIVHHDLYHTGQIMLIRRAEL